MLVGSTVIKSEAEAEGLDGEHGGRRYWLCCDICADLFDANPDWFTGPV